MKPRDLTIAEKAKSALLQRGWRQGFRNPFHPNVCFTEALAIALDTPGLEGHQLDDLLRSAVTHLGFEHPNQAITWNDTPGRTFEQVLNRLDAWA